MIFLAGARAIRGLLCARNEAFAIPGSFALLGPDVPLQKASIRKAAPRYCFRGGASSQGVTRSLCRQTRSGHSHRAGFAETVFIDAFGFALATFIAPPPSEENALNNPAAEGLPPNEGPGSFRKRR
jgi:hypothetical protein